MGKGSRSRQSEQSVAETHQSGAPKKSTGKIVRNVLIGILVAAFVGIGAFGILSETGVLMGKLKAYTVGDQTVSAREYKIYYKTAEINLINTQGATLQMYYGVDLTKPLETQPYGDGTWGDYLHENTQASLKQIYILYDEALKNGYELAGDDDPIYLGLIASYRASADLYEMDLEKYVKAAYGTGIKLADLEDSARIRATAMNYYHDYIEDLGVTDKDIEARYEDNPFEFDLTDYRSFTIPYKTVQYEPAADGKEPEAGAPKNAEEAEAMTAKNRDEAQKKADEFLSKITDEKSFIALSKEYAEGDDVAKYKDDDATLTEGAALKNGDTSKVLAWCAANERVEGDTEVLDTGTGITVLYFLDRYLPEVPTATVRHILIKAPEAAEDATEEEKAAAKEQDEAAKAEIEEIYEEWKSGDMTEDSFAALARDNSHDAGSVPDGGRITDFAEGVMVPEFNDWVFDSARQEGDTDIVKTVHGYHLIYYVGEGDTEWKVEARSQIEHEKFDEYYAELEKNYPTEVNDYGMGLAY